MRVGSGDCVRVRSPLVEVDDLGEVLDIDLMHDPGSRRNHLESAEGLLAPLEESVAFGIALVLAPHVQPGSIGAVEEVRDD